MSLDEGGEFPAAVLDALRQPLESGVIQVHRSGVAATYPARFQLVVATNPCPCGQYGVAGGRCECAPQAIRRYTRRLSGPLLDRIDIDLRLQRVSAARRESDTRTVTTAQARETVARAREHAAVRWAATPWRRNADVPGTWLRGPAAPSPAVLSPLDAALRRGALTLRGYDRLLRVRKIENWQRSCLGTAYPARGEPLWPEWKLGLPRSVRSSWLWSRLGTRF